MKNLICIFLILSSFHTFAQTRLNIIEIGHPTLRALAKEVHSDDINTPDFQTFIDDMVHTMNKAGGVGLAAPQVNESLKMFVMKNAFQVPLAIVINPTIEYLEEFGKKTLLKVVFLFPVNPESSKI
jgi:peptide deformylase